jgi:succinate dehydrogenase hydrophobic anchor subunit
LFQDLIGLGFRGATVEPESEKKRSGLRAWFNQLATSKKVILVVMLIWLAQAIPKWTAAITASDELSAKIMKVFITPR